MVTIFPERYGFYQQYNVACRKGSEIVWWVQQRLWGVASEFPRSWSNLASVGCAGQSSTIHVGRVSQSNISVPGTSAHIQGSCGIERSVVLWQQKIANASASCRINSGNASRGLLALRFSMNKYASPCREVHHRSVLFWSLKAHTYTKVTPGDCTESKRSMLLVSTRGLP